MEVSEPAVFVDHAGIAVDSAGGVVDSGIERAIDRQIGGVQKEGGIPTDNGASIAQDLKGQVTTGGNIIRAYGNCSTPSDASRAKDSDSYH